MENVNEQSAPLYLAIIYLLIIILIIRFFKRLFTKKRCSWCKSPSIKFLSGQQGDWHWEYRNKDGSRDKRVKGNYQIAGYTSEFECKKCGAKTRFKHFSSKKPSKKVKIWLRKLISEGTGERKGKDWESKKGVRYSASDENRKNS